MWYLCFYLASHTGNIYKFIGGVEDAEIPENFKRSDILILMEKQQLIRPR